MFALSTDSTATPEHCSFAAIHLNLSAGITPLDMPFGIVQLAPWGNDGEESNTCGESDDCEVATVRWGQTANRGSVPSSVLPNTFMAVTTDLGDFASPYGSIHPRE